MRRLKAPELAMNASFCHLEIVVMRFDVLLRDVFGDDLVRDIPAVATK